MTTGAGSAVDAEALAAFAFIVNASVDAIYQVDRTGRIISWNPSAARMSGHADADVLGSQHVLLFPAHRRSQEADVLRRALLGERIERGETELERPDGLLVPVELTASPLFDRSGQIVGASVIAHDITEQRLAQEFLAESQARLQEAQELASVGMWTWDIRTDSVQYSEPLYRILDVDPQTFAGAFDDLVGCVVPDQQQGVRAALRDAGRTGDPVRLECGVIRPTGGDGWVSIRAEAERASGGDIVGLRGIVQDLTDRHLAEVAVRDALVRERHAAEQLRAADRLKDEFLSTVSHEMRTPLTSIIGLVGVMVDRGGEVDHLAPDLILRIQRNAEEMRAMIERLLDFSRLEAGRVVLRPVEVVLREVIDQSIVQSDVALAEHQLEVAVSQDLTVVADPEALTRVLVNLLTNAAKFSPSGSGIHIDAREHEAEIIVSVRDEGAGMDATTAVRVFERFFQVEDDQRAGKRGTGVGLSIVQRYVEMHGGARLGRQRGRARCDVRVLAALEWARTVMTSILVVDDEEDIRLLTRLVLEPAGYVVLEAAGGQDALDRLADASVDLMILDIRMSGMDGWAVMRALEHRAVAAKPRDLGLLCPCRTRGPRGRARARLRRCPPEALHRQGVPRRRRCRARMESEPVASAAMVERIRRAGAVCWALCGVAAVARAPRAGRVGVPA